MATGEIFAYMAAMAGLEVYTTRTIPAEIKGGHVMYQMRAALDPLTAMGDEIDVLLAYDEETYERYYKLLRPEGVLVYNSNDVKIEATGKRNLHIGVPLHDIAKSLSFARGYNMVAVGALVKLFDMDMEFARQGVRRRLGKGRAAESLPVNLAALEKGYEYIENLVSKEAPFHLPTPTQQRDERLIISGNQAISMGVIAANCRFMAGYPITPASEIMEFLAIEFPKIGGTMIQAEDEIAACGMALGASFTGVRSMTATSGPGLALMIEMLGHASMTETPLLIVDVQRAGPSTGMPTKVSQGDLRLACYGGNDDGPRIVVAPTTVEDCFYLMIHAFNLTEKYQTPVIFMSDQDMAVRVQTIAPFDLSKVFHEPRLLYNPSGNGAGPTSAIKTRPAASRRCPSPARRADSTSRRAWSITPAARRYSASSCIAATCASAPASWTLRWSTSSSTSCGRRSATPKRRSASSAGARPSARCARQSWPPSTTACRCTPSIRRRCCRCPRSSWKSSWRTSARSSCRK